ncbi:hypothetical protein PR202_gb09880 [Eleusine coracana subsp. coracana]|uniref:Uncharacterized protein n=1 Tax=Eleusine coracana subsp. coracana TaxID=191504 RepID=A0AAV5EI66_ELECO|nr:hypothetical protein PR202_gb09880 [Eleusine coracana subsp. coracana]
MRVRYHGPRTVKSLAAFYTDVSGINASMKSTAGEAMLHSFNDIEHRKDADPENCPFWWARSPEKIHSFNDIEHRKDADPENCPFWWARSPEKILQQDTYLALATAFVILRLLYLLYPKIDSVARWTWRRHGGVHGYFLTYLEQARQKFHRLYPSKRGNLQEGAMNATAWASKSLASVSIGESSAIGRTNSTSELR